MSQSTITPSSVGLNYELKSKSWKQEAEKGFSFRVDGNVIDMRSKTESRGTSPHEAEEWMHH